MKSDKTFEAYLPNGHSLVNNELIVSFRWKGKEEKYDSVPFIPMRLERFDYDDGLYRPVHDSTFKDQIRWLVDYSKLTEDIIFSLIGRAINGELVTCPVCKISHKDYFEGNDRKLIEFLENNGLSLHELNEAMTAINNKVNSLNIYVFLTKKNGCVVTVK